MNLAKHANPCYFLVCLVACGGSSAEEGGDAAVGDAQDAVDASTPGIDASAPLVDAGPLPDADNCPAPYLVFLNTAGTTVTDGPENSLLDQFPFVFGESVVLPAWPGTNLDAVLPCLQTIFADFHVAFTNTAPGDVPHLEVVMTGSSVELGLFPGNLEAFTMSSNACGQSANPMSFVFDDSWTDDEHLCRGLAQAVGWGIALEPSGSCADIASSIECPGPATITNAVAECGHQGGLDCQCTDGTTQNSYERLTDFVGLSCP